MSSSQTSHHRATASQSSISSPLAQAPKFSLPTSASRPASPSRRPLHQRSDSDRNRNTAPTIRIVGDDKVYSKFPIPSEPSQILPPPRHAPGYTFEQPASRVSSSSKVANVIAKFEASRALEPVAPLQQRKQTSRYSASTSNSEADTLVAPSFTPTSNRFSRDRFSQGSTTTLRVSPPPELTDFQKGLEVLEETPASSPKHTIRAVPPSSSGGDSVTSRTRALSQATSEASIASTIRLASPTKSSNDENPTSVDRPLPQGHRNVPSNGSEEGQPSHSSNIYDRQPVLKPSTESFAFSDISSTSIEPAQSNIVFTPTVHEAQTATFTSGARLSFPIVRKQSSNSLRADQNTPITVSGMPDRGLGHTWSSTLSTIPSLSERDSRSFARGSRSFGTRSHSQDSLAGNGRNVIVRRRGQTIGSTHTSSDNLSSENSEYSAVPLPLFSPASPALQGSPGRESGSEKDEYLDTVSPLPSSGPLRMKTSGYLRRTDSTESLNSSRPGSSQSDVSLFISNTIPAWAKAYYQRGERISVMGPESDSSGSIRLGTGHSRGRSRTPSESQFPANIYRPRNRPRDRSSTITADDNEQPMEGDYYILGPDGQMTRLSRYATPRLRSDNRGQRYSMWNAPSLDSNLGSTLFGRQNRQVLLFCLGFLCPLLWIVASFLPLPPDPKFELSPSQADLEEQFAQEIGPINDKPYQKARWWRNLNRVMSGIGSLLIGVIVALVILITRMN